MYLLFGRYSVFASFISHVGLLLLYSCGFISKAQKFEGVILNTSSALLLAVAAVSQNSPCVCLDSLVSEPLGNSRPVCCDGLEVQEKRFDQLVYVVLQRDCSVNHGADV